MIKDESLDKIVELIENSMREEGYITKRYSQTDGKFGTTSYDCLILRDENGREYTLSIDKRLKLNRETWNLETTNDLGSEANKIMKFFEFSGTDFGYYALIGAMSEEEAIKYYSETVGDIEDENAEPTQIEKLEAKKKLLSICKDSDEESKLTKEFNKSTLGTEPYLILIDGSLL